MAKKQKIVMLGSGVSAGDLSLKADKASPTFTGPVTSSGAVVSPGTTMSGVQINVALRDNLYSATGDVTWTHSATPAVGQEYGVIVTTDGTARTITYPVTVFSQARGADITDSTFPANSTNKIIVRRTASGYLILGDPLTLAQMRTALGLATVATSGSAADLSAGVLAPARIAPGGSALQVVRLNAGNTALEYADPGVGSGDVTAASNFATDNRIIRSDGTGKGVQSSGAAINDSGEIQVLGDSIPGSITLSDGHATVPVAGIISAPVSYSSGYTLVLPTSPGTAGQAIRIASVSGSTLALEFYTP